MTRGYASTNAELTRGPTKQLVLRSAKRVSCCRSVQLRFDCRRESEWSKQIVFKMTTVSMSSVQPKSKACRNLFGPVDHSEVKRSTTASLASIYEADMTRWNFNFRDCTPLSGGRLMWEKVADNDRGDIPPAYKLGRLPYLSGQTVGVGKDISGVNRRVETPPSVDRDVHSGHFQSEDIDKTQNDHKGLSSPVALLSHSQSSRAEVTHSTSKISQTNVTEVTPSTSNRSQRKVTGKDRRARREIHIFIQLFVIPFLNTC